MDKKDIYELLDLYGNGGVPNPELKKIQWKNMPPEKVLQILETYDDMSRQTELSDARVKNEWQIQ